MSDFIKKVIQTHLPDLNIFYINSVTGGCINNAVQVITNNGAYFLKSNSSNLSGMFIAEKQGLAILKKYSSIISPQVIATDTLENKSYLLTEWLTKGTPNPLFWERFAKNLALQHQITSPCFGLDHDNFIGSLTQSNIQHAKWHDFFIAERLTPQLKLASSKKLIGKEVRSKFESLFQKLVNLIPDEKPALLHGDLWSGNFMITESGEAAIFDPAVHYGHRETEIAFTNLFGGFDQRFYAAYYEYQPLEPGFEDRVDIHNLYPLLVHVNLFGSAYLSGIIQTLNRFT